MTGRCPVDERVDVDAVLDDRGDQFAGQIGRDRIPFRVCQMPLEDRLGRALSEVGFEDRRERESTAGRATSASVREPTTPSRARSAVSRRRHRR